MSPGHLRRRSDASSAGPDLLSSEPGSNFHGRQSFEARNDDDITDDDERVTRTFPQERFLVDELGFGDESIKVRVVGERAKWWKIYTMHFMFMWNTRTYEYASVSSSQSSRNRLTYDWKDHPSSICIPSKSCGHLN